MLEQQISPENPQTEPVLDWSPDLINYLKKNAKRQKKGSGFYSTYERGLDHFTHKFPQINLPQEINHKADTDQPWSGLEFGAGSGQTAVDLARATSADFHYTGISIEDLRSPEFKQIQNADYLVTSFQEFLLDNQNTPPKYDWIGSSHAIEYFPLAIDAIRLAYRFLRAGGTFTSIDSRIYDSKIFADNSLGIKTIYDYFLHFIQPKIDAGELKDLEISLSSQKLVIKKGANAPQNLPFPFRPQITTYPGKKLFLGKIPVPIKKKRVEYVQI